MDRERKILLEVLNNESIKNDIIQNLKNVVLQNPKSAEASTEARKKGNDLLLQQKKHDAETHKAIFSHYCKSIALAPIKSQQLAVAYGNRSYLLLHMHKYEDCIKDIDQALEMSNCDLLKAKLLCRKAECLKKLGLSNTLSTLEMAQNLAEKVDGQDRIKLLNMIDTVKSLAVDREKVEMRSHEKQKIENHELLTTEDYSSCLSIEYNEKYGRHLVAAKDYKPGDIIFVEKMYATALAQELSLLSCNHCPRHSWSSIPCEHCSWSMYCSEACKEQAWIQYHDVECSLVSHLKGFSDVSWGQAVMAVRILIIAIKESGSIANLMKELELLDQRTDKSSKDFFNDDKFGINNFQNVYSLISYVPYDPTVGFCKIVPSILVSLTKYSQLKDGFNVKQFEDLEKNDDIMFLGSLLIKIISVLSCNAFGSVHDTFQCTLKKSEMAHCEVKRCLSIIFSLFNHSCFPTAHWCCTDQNQVVVYALQPIKKNSQIFIAYRYGFENEIPSVRQAKFAQKYNFTCYCRACVEGWRPIKMNGYIPDEKEADVVNDIETRKFSIEDLQEITETLRKRGQINKSHIKILSSLITQGLHWKQPSEMLCNLITFLKTTFEKIYSPEALLFDKCD